MMRTVKAIGMTVPVIMLTSCGAPFRFAAPAKCTEATELKNVCAAVESGGTELKEADSLYNQGTVLIRKGKDEKAYWLLDRAIVRYRLVLAKSAIGRKEKEIALQKQALSKTREDISAYKQVLLELENMERQQ